jgi:hypothetical protein
MQSYSHKEKHLRHSDPDDPAQIRREEGNSECPAEFLPVSTFYIS